jgi:hypothetical protein
MANASESRAAARGTLEIRCAETQEQVFEKMALGLFAAASRIINLKEIHS